MCPRIDFRNVYILLILGSAICVSSYRVELIDNGPIVKGANITFKASVYYGDKLAEGTFVYSWKDMALPTHTREYKATSPIDEWIVSYNSSIYPQGPYIVQVTVCKYYLVYCAEIASNRVEFYINETLNGDILFIQNNKTRPDLFVSNAEPVIHNVSLKQTDAEYIKQAPSVLTYWFVDCVYWGFRNDFEFSFNYTQAEREHLVEALVIADFSPPPPPLTTTTVKPTTTTTKTTKPSTTVTTTKPTTTTTKPTTTTTKPTTTTNSTKVKRDVGPQSKIWVSENGTLQPFKGTYPFVCNGTQVATDEQKTYGYFFKKVKVRAPVAKVNVTGNNWLQHGDLLTLNVRCHGSKNFKYCVQYQKGLYNVTGNETCYFYQELDKCEFTIQRYFVDSMEHTVVIIIQNEVSKIVYPVTVTVYKVQRQAQLSVIVVPVAFSLVAVVLIVFGVAYYIQNRSRFVVEVADFNFGQNYSDMEYKTFKERLRDAIANAFFTRAPSPGSSEVPVWPPGRKYGSMTS